MRVALVVVVVLVACGRLEFARAPELDGGGAPDTMRDPDSGALCAEPVCKLVLDQCGCATGQACQRVGATTDERGCIAEGTAGPSEVCTTDAQCVAGHACIALRAGEGRCQPYCASDADCAGASACANLVEGVGIGMCGAACTPGSGCPPGSACKVMLALDFDSAEPVAVAFCDTPSGGSVGASCGSSLDCTAGLFCDVSASGQCRPMCRFDGMLDCPSGACSTVDAPIVLGGITYGVCR